MRTVLLTLMITFPVIGLLVSLYFGVTLQRFITTTPEIRSRDELERFKQVVKTQMYAALAQGAILIIPTLLLFYGFLSRTLVMLDIVYLLIPSLILLGVAIYFKPIERQVQTLPVADPQLQQERDCVVDVWKHKPFPNW
jgi:hypothetical protein